MAQSSILVPLLFCYMDKLNSIAKKMSSNTNLLLDQREIRLIRYGRHIFIRGVKKIGVE